MDDKVCDFLREVDENFNNGGVNVVKFNKFKKCHSYCPHQNNLKENKCTNDYERINALGSYLFKKISEIDKAFKEGSNSDKRHIEIFMMWLGEKLFRIDNDYKSTLEESYIKNLEKSMGNIDYWKVTDSKKLYKKATIKKMSEYYGLLNYICKLITEYNKNPLKPNRSRIGTYSSQCDNFYKTIHNSINECGPYLQLLDSLKMIFEVFRIQKIVNNYNIKESDKALLLNRVKSLTTFQNVNKYFVTVNPKISFDDKECKDVKSKDEKIGEQIASQKSKNPIRRAQTRVSGNAQRINTGSRNPGSPQPKQPPAQLNYTPPAPAKPSSSPQSLPSEKDTKLKTTQAGKTHQNGPEDTVNGADGGKGDAGSGVNGGGSVQGDKGSKNGASEGGLGSSSKTQAGSDIGTGSIGGASGGKGGSNSNIGVKNSESDVSGGGTSSGASGGQDGKKVGSNDVEGGKVDGKGGSSGGAGGGKEDADRGVNGGGSVQGDQGKSSDKTGSGPGGHADKDNQGGSENQTKLSGNSSHGSSVPAHPTTAPSGTDTTPSSGTPQSSVQQPDPQKPGPPPQPQSDPPTVPPAQDGRSSQTSQTGGSSNQNEQKDPNNSKGSTGDTKDNKGDPNSGNGNPDDGSSGPTSSTSVGSFDWRSSIFEFILKGKEYYNKASEFIKDNQQKFKDAAEKISDAYNDTVENLKSAYNASSDYLNKFISDVTSQLNQLDSPPKSDRSGNILPQNIDQSPKNGNSPPLPPSNNPQPPSPTDPSSNQPSAPSIDPQKITPPALPPNSMPNTTQGPSKVSLQQSQSFLQSQPTTHNPAQLDPPNHKANTQLVKLPNFNLNLKKPWNIFPTTWNGSGDCKPEIKFMNATLVCCTSEQCNLTGIPVILVLIPIILLIAYKYLSFVLSKKSEKKTMKRVIKLVDGNIKTKIIISSNDRSKHLKPVINSVGGKKDSLLNIYKLIRADPMPFINLFFLLIFFVYKRKRDTIE
ncbi:PIR protein CIR protein [Plasmodium vinckei lentum]|uniref:PIR protein CIR protein n=1 Tax=Plasmodium vinckei lentum TaxID=138297 RepID=A0A6V7RRY5_PLAVN|nr:PIR protein CIR protein [Plasmodium vinckei lentum]